MNEQELMEQLKKEGFTEVYVWEDGPNAEYPQHTHDKLTAHVILQGDMVLNDHGRIKELKVGDRFDIPAGTVHSAKCGPKGCRFIIGEK